MKELTNEELLELIREAYAKLTTEQQLHLMSYMHVMSLEDLLKYLQESLNEQT